MSVVPSARNKRAMAASAHRFSHHLMHGSPLYHYFRQERGLTDETLRQFVIGEVPEDDEEYPDHRGWGVIPFLTATGFVDLRFRRPPDSDHPAKYKSRPGSSPRLFNTNAILQAENTIILAEGEMDTIILTQIGLHAVGVPGASSWRKPFELAIHGFDNIIICEDGDDDGAGKNLTNTILKGIDWATTVRFEGTDVNDYYLEHGPQALRDKILAPLREQAREEEEEGDDEYAY